MAVIANDPRHIFLNAMFGSCRQHRQRCQSADDRDQTKQAMGGVRSKQYSAINAAAPTPMAIKNLLKRFILCTSPFTKSVPLAGMNETKTV